MILCVDMGNTFTHFAAFDGLDLVEQDRVPTAEAGRLPPLASDRRYTRVAVGSVAPSRTHALLASLEHATGQAALVAGVSLPIPIRNLARPPERVGVDRLFNALAAWRRVRGQAVVVSIGTAITVDLLTAAGAFGGGAIAPGPDLLMRAMTRAELLPAVEFALPARAAGLNTDEAMRSGAWWGVVGAVERLVAQVRQESSGPARVLATGGWAAALAPHIASVDEVVPTLTLEGLAIAALAVP